MALTAYPVISYNSSTGSDTLASGAGPSTAIIGTATAANSPTIALVVSSGTLSQVAQDGSHAIWISGVGWARISSRDTVGITVTVETPLTCTAATFAIGAKRRSIATAADLALFAATSSPTASGASGQWTIELEDDQSFSGTITCSATAGTGAIIVRSNSTSTRRTITQTGSTTIPFTMNTANKWEFQGIQFRHSGATKAYVFTSSSTAQVVLRNCIVGDSGGTNCPSGLWTRSASGGFVVLFDSSVLRCGSVGINGSTSVIMVGSEISRCGGAGISIAGATCTATASIISHNSGDGINATGGNTISVTDCVIHGNTGDGIELTGAALTGLNAQIVNNQITSNGAYGVNMSGGGTLTPLIEYNNFDSNTTAASTGFTLSATNTTVAPAYTDPSAGVRNFAPGPASWATGFPASTGTIAAGQTGTTSYVDQGVAQHRAGNSSRGLYTGGRL